MRPAELRARRLAAQGLHPPAGGTPAGVVRRLLAVQAQDFRAARLAVRARAPGGPRASNVDDALTRERSLVAAWLMRGTLHLVARDDYPWLLALTAPTREAGARRRFGQLGVTPDTAERAVGVIADALASDGPLDRPALAGRMAARGIPTAGQATPHLLALAVRRGVAVLGPVRDGEPVFALVRDWLGEDPRVPDRDAALAELARRWLAAHGPATEQDLAAWSGLPLRDAREGLQAIAARLRHHEGGLVELADGDEAARGVERAGDDVRGAGRARGAAPPRLLPAFDPYLLGWRDRGFAVAARDAARVHPGGGMLRAVATAGGRVVGTWSARRRGRRLAVAVDPFVPLPARTARALAADARDVARFEGLEPG